MKRSLFLLLASLLAFGTLTACSDDDDDTEPTNDVTDDTTADADAVDDSTDDTGETVEPVTNACSDTDNQAAFAAYATAAGDECAGPDSLASDAALEECNAIECASGECTEEEIQGIVNCIVSELTETTGIDDTCGGCYGELAACVIANCALNGCINPSSEACGQCIEANGCNTELETCSGLNADFSPCGGGEEAVEEQPVEEQPVKQ